jgi:hypothetical protein
MRLVDPPDVKGYVMYPLRLLAGGQAFLVMGRDPHMGPMDIGDRLNFLQQQGLPWNNVAFAPVSECRIRR